MNYMCIFMNISVLSIFKQDAKQKLKATVRPVKPCFFKCPNQSENLPHILAHWMLSSPSNNHILYLLHYQTPCIYYLLFLNSYRGNDLWQGHRWLCVCLEKQLNESVTNLFQSTLCKTFIGEDKRQTQVWSQLPNFKFTISSNLYCYFCCLGHFKNYCLKKIKKSSCILIVYQRWIISNVSYKSDTISGCN
jgi:hypothetical protein